MDQQDRQQQFTALLHEHRGIVFKLARAYARNAADLDDLAQEIALQLWRSLGTFDARRAKFTTWMYRVALNVAISHVRMITRGGGARTEPPDDAHAETLVDPAPLQYDSLERDERSALLYATIARLDPLNRALVLLYLEDRSYAEIAEVLGISETNVATKLNRIKQQLREQVAATKSAGEKNGTR